MDHLTPVRALLAERSATIRVVAALTAAETAEEFDAALGLAREASAAGREAFETLLSVSPELAGAHTRSYQEAQAVFAALQKVALARVVGDLAPA